MPTSKKVYIETYGCQMNVSDTEIVSSILKDEGYEDCNNPTDADLILLNTCSIREKAEQTIRNRLKHLNYEKGANSKVGILGCMAERLKEKLIESEKIVDMVVGPDAYQSIPSLLDKLEEDKPAIDVKLSLNETYDNITPLKSSINKISTFVTITRGCDNMCTFCVVPFTRGRERSKDPNLLLEEIKQLEKQNYKEVTLLGQNVDSYLWYGGGPKKSFNQLSDIQKASAIKFSDLLEMVAIAVPNMRIRFSTSNPQDMDLEGIKVMAKYDNIAKHIHLPIQSGSDNILEKMNRKHTRDEYLDLVYNINKHIPECSISQDMIAGFCDETEDDHKLTLDLMEKVKYHFGYMYRYSERPGTLAAKKFEDNVPMEDKKRRLSEIIKLQSEHSAERNKFFIGKTVQVLIEGTSRKVEDKWFGRNSQNIAVVFPKENAKPGDFVNVLISETTAATLKGKIAKEKY